VDAARVDVARDVAMAADSGIKGDTLAAADTVRPPDLFHADTLMTTPDKGTPCTAPAANDLHYVDPINGMDLPNHGGVTGSASFGACAYKTLTYALSQTTQAQIALASGEYDAASGETFPIVLTGNQSILCQYPTPQNVTIKGKGTYAKIGIAVTIAFEGVTNQIYGCTIDGGGGIGYCVDVNSQGNATGSGNHGLYGATVQNCGGNAVNVETTGGGLTVSSTIITNSLDGIGFATSTDQSPASIINNSFSGNSAHDFQCQGTSSDPSVTGSGNTEPGGLAPTCIGCKNCPF
jgi:hypothetical protein